MSCIRVGIDTINRVVYGILLTDDTGFKREKADQLGRDLIRLNQAAFTHCYQGRHSASLFTEDQIAAYRYNEADGKAMGETQVVMSLEFFRYQCSEGKIDQTDLYKEVEQAKLNLAYMLFTHTKEWTASQWN